MAIYGHGTGGDHLSFVREGSSISPASSLAEAGILGFGVSLPLHGDRAAGLDPALASFNYLNPDSARSCFRQGALDQIYIATLLSRLPHRFETTSDTIRTDPSRVAYMGHSRRAGRRRDHSLVRASRWCLSGGGWSVDDARQSRCRRLRHPRDPGKRARLL